MDRAGGRPGARAGGDPEHRADVQRAVGGGRRRAWPDDAARAFAVEFAAVYLDHADGHDPAAAAQAMARFASGDLADALAPRLNGRGPRQTIGSVAVSRVERLDREHALITVVASVTGEASRWCG